MILYAKPLRPLPHALTLRLLRGFADHIKNEYHFFVDFQGLLFFDDQQVHRNPLNQIRDRKFIAKLYQELRPNEGPLAQRYPHFAEFWGERNYLRAAISPIIFNALHDGHLEFSLGMTLPFKPELLAIDPLDRFTYPFSNAHTTIRGICSNQLTGQLLAEAEEGSEGVRVKVGGHDVLVLREGRGG